MKFWLCILFAACSSAAATEIKIVHPTIDGEITLKVDDRRVNVEALKRYLAKHPTG